MEFPTNDCNSSSSFRIGSDTVGNIVSSTAMLEYALMSDRSVWAVIMSAYGSPSYTMIIDPHNAPDILSTTQDPDVPGAAILK